jgi:Rod binding domain-containing protein
MTVPAIQPTLLTLRPAQPGTGEVQPDRKIRQAARQFEAVLVRQMLNSAGFGGEGKEGAYAGMIVDALADGVTAGRGLGLAQKVADALARASHGQR